MTGSRGTSFFIFSSMEKFILGKKVGMTTVYNEKGEAHNVTLVECEPNNVSLIRTKEKDGYLAAQLEIKKNKKANLKREFRIDDLKFKEGDKVSVEIFEMGEKVSVSGKTKAKGFQGVVKRHGFGGAPKSHGHKHDLRAPGSIGAGYPEHVIKGKRMAGRMGGKKATSENVKVSCINKEKNLIGLKGAVPGIPGTIVEIYKK